MPSNARHYAAIATENPSAPGTAVPAQKFIAYSEYSSNAVPETDPDKGHTGARGLTISNDRTTASSKPSPTNRLRPDDELGYYLQHWFGEVTVTRNIPSTGLSYKHAFEEYDGTLPTATIYHGYNYSSETAKRMPGAKCNTLKFNFSTKAAPTVAAEYMGYFPTYGVTEPTLSYSTTQPFKTGQLAVYLDDYGGTIGSTAMSGFREMELTLDNKMEVDFEAGQAYGSVLVDEGDLTVTGSYKRKFSEAARQDHVKWATGSTSGTAPSANSLFKLIRVKYTTVDMIETIYPWYLQLDILKADIIESVETESGEGQKMYDVKFEGVVDTSSSTKIEAELQCKIPSFGYIV